MKKKFGSSAEYKKLVQCRPWVRCYDESKDAPCLVREDGIESFIKADRALNEGSG